MKIVAADREDLNERGILKGGKGGCLLSLTNLAGLFRFCLAMDE
jgi:hypothetical protein